MLIARIVLIGLLFQSVEANGNSRNYGAVLSEIADLYFTSELVSDTKPEHPIVWYWEHDFNEAEKRMIKEWLNKVHIANVKTLGDYPFKVHMHVYLRKNGREPVPWANTWRYPNQSLHFHIDPDFSLDTFIEDWTAAHEFSHLSIPYLGESNAWFAEGYASFMQYQVMSEMGLFTKEEVYEKYYEKLKNIRSYYMTDLDLISTAKQLRKNNKYPQMYWGSASYFILLDQILKNKYATNLCDVVSYYQECCRLKGRSLSSVLEHWDQIIGYPEATQLLLEFEKEAASDIIIRTEKLDIFN